jgi:hypothetical protein
VTQIKHYGKPIPKFARYLRTWGEAGTVKIGKDGKTGDRGATMIMVGYANNHVGDVFRMLNFNTGRITETRDIIWLQRLYFEHKRSDKTDKLPVVCIPVIVGQQNTSDVADAELLEPHIKEEEGTNTSSVPAQNVNRFGCTTGIVTPRFVPGVNVGISAIHNYYAVLQEIDNEEVKLNTELAMFY